MQRPERYEEKRAFYSRVLTVYGRKPALEALQDDSLQCLTLHLARSNREVGIVADLRRLAGSREVPVKLHSREELARISRNGKQDQGVAVDIICPSFRPLEDYLRVLDDVPPQRLLALDGISNPQNLGMIVRSATAGGMDGIIYCRRGNAALGPLVIKASAGTLYRAPLLLDQSLPDALRQCQQRGAHIYTLQANAQSSLFEHARDTHRVYVLGNETTGISPAVAGMTVTPLSIPMDNSVESLNVAVTAGLIAYASYLDR